MATLVQSNYEQLQQISRRFQARAQTILKTTQLLSERTTKLQKSWEGAGAIAFAQEMQRVVLPAMMRLQKSFQSAAQTTHKIALVLQNAEEEAAALFRATESTIPFTRPTSEGVTVFSDGLRTPNSGSNGANTDNTKFVALEFPPTPNEDAAANAYIAGIERLVKREGERETLLKVFPDLARLGELSDSELRQLYTDMKERRDLLNLLYLMEIMPTDFAYKVPNDPETLPLDALRALVHPIGEPGANLHRMMVYEAMENMISTLPVEDYMTLTEQSKNFSPQQMASYVLSLFVATRQFPNEEGAGDFPLGAAIVIGSPDSAVSALLESTLAKLSLATPRDPNDPSTMLLDKLDKLMESAAIDDNMTMGQATTLWMTEMVEGFGVENSARYNSALFPLYVMLESGSPDTTLTLFDNISAINGLGPLGALDFVGALTREGMNRLPTTDLSLGNMVTERLAQLESGMGSGTPHDSLNVTDIAVEGVPNLMYGQTSTTAGAEMAYIYNTTTRPDPTIGVFVSIDVGGYDSELSAAAPDDYVEFDWYTVNNSNGQSAITLIDTQYTPPSNNGQIYQMAIDHTEAANVIGENVTVQWVIPPNSDVSAQQVQDFLGSQFPHITVIESTLPNVDYNGGITAP